MIYDTFKKLAFQMDPEKVHDLSFIGLKNFPKLFTQIIPGVKIDSRQTKYRITTKNLDWFFPLAVAAGLDKNGVALPYFKNLGFGSIEVGTVTPKPQEGNPKPRLFRYPHKLSFRNSMGFPNEGGDKIYSNIKDFKKEHFSVGLNIGKNKSTSVDKTAEDYAWLFKKFHVISDYIVVNVSSPNTEGLRNFQHTEHLSVILKALQEEKTKAHTDIPILVKIAPDLLVENVIQIVNLVKGLGINGIVATNTSIFENLGKGGISGKLIYDKSRNIRNTILENIKETPNIDLIGCGGFYNFEQILDYWRNGGKFIQIYTSFIYRGPEILREVKQKIDSILKNTNAKNLQELFDQNFFTSGKNKNLLH